MENKPMIGGFDFDQLRKDRFRLYTPITINLSTARTDDELTLTGTYIYAAEATDGSANIDIRFNELVYGTVNLKRGRGVRCPFYRFFVTNTAQAGKTITLFVGVGEELAFEILDRGQIVNMSGDVNIEYDKSNYLSIQDEIEHGFFGGVNVAAAASVYGMAGLYNENAGCIVIVDSIKAYMDVTGINTMGMGIFDSTDLAHFNQIENEQYKKHTSDSLTGGSYCRIRWGRQSTTQVFLSAGNGAFFRVNTAANVYFETDFPGGKPVLTYQYGIGVCVHQVNIPITVQFQWRVKLL